MELERPVADESELRMGILELEGRECAWGIPSSEVRGVHRESEWSGEPPLDAASVLGIGLAAESESRRIVVVNAAEKRRAVLVRGKISFSEVAVCDVLEVPPGLSESGRHNVSWHLVLGPGGIRLLLLDPRSLP